MLDEAAFLQEIRADPEDDGPRLVFADWLEEQGDPRSEFIRVQCAIAAETEAEDDELLERNQFLTAAARERVLTTLQPLGVKDVRFHRGFIDKLQISGTRFLDLPRTLVAAAPTLRAVLWQDLPDRQQAEALRRFLTSTHFTCVTALDLSRNSIGNAGLRACAESPQLARLISLNLANNRLAGQGIRELTDSPYLGGLTSLNLNANELSAEDARLIARCASLISLQHLWLDRNPIGDRGLEELAASPHGGYLETLSLNNTRVGVPGVRSLANSPYLKRLQVLLLGFARLGPTGASVLATSSNFSGLVRLDLEGCRIGDEGLRALAATTHLRNLQNLDLSSNELGDDVRLLPPSELVRKLTTLTLSDNRITLEAAETLLTASQLAGLETLDLRGNPIRDPQALVARFGPRFRA